MNQMQMERLGIIKYKIKEQAVIPGISFIVCGLTKMFHI